MRRRPLFIGFIGGAVLGALTEGCWIDVRTAVSWDGGRSRSMRRDPSLGSSRDLRSRGASLQGLAIETLKQGTEAKVETVERVSIMCVPFRLGSGQHLVKEPTEPGGTRRYSCDIRSRPSPAKVLVTALPNPSLTRKRAGVRIPQRPRRVVVSSLQIGEPWLRPTRWSGSSRAWSLTCSANEKAIASLGIE